MSQEVDDFTCIEAIRTISAMYRLEEMGLSEPGDDI
jgi:hypothetical protein